MKSKDNCFLAGKQWQTCTVCWKQRHYSADKGPYGQGCGLSSGHVRLWELDYKEGRVQKNWCLWTVVLEKTPESSLDSKQIKPVNLKGNQAWILIGRTDAEAETPVFWSFYANSWLIGKVPDAGKDWGRKEKKASQDEMAGWHLQCYGHKIRSDQITHSVMSNSLRPHESQHARPPCPSPSPKVCPSSCPLHQWCHPAISSSDALFSSCPQSFPASGTFSMSQLFASNDQNTGVSASASVFPMSIQGWFWKVVAEAWKDAGILGFRRRRIQSGARDEAWLLRPFV